MFIAAVIFITIILVIAFVATVMLGRSQKPSQNAQYEQSRVKTLLLITFLYVISNIFLIAIVYFYIIK